MKDMILYHGSREGIVGDIVPKSRPTCDFGEGFYMGTSKMQAQSLVVNSSSPIIYTLRLKLSEIPENRILTLEGKDWLYAVLANRRLCKPFNKLDIAHKWLKRTSQYDVIIGAIADDSMAEAIKNFVGKKLTDKELYDCLNFVDYGVQYVAKTDDVCKHIEKLAEKPLKGQEADFAYNFNKNKMREGKQAIYNVHNSGKGIYIDQFIKQEKAKEQKGR